MEKGIPMFDPHEDVINRQIARLCDKAEEGGYDDDPDFLEMIDRLYQKRAEMYAGRVNKTNTYLPPLPSLS